MCRNEPVEATVFQANFSTMQFDLSKSIEILERTPAVLKTLLAKLSDDWVFENEGPDTWSPYEVIGHLIHCEKTDWLVRAQVILSEKEDKTFEPFDRFAQLKAGKEKPLEELLEEFQVLREKNLEELKSMQINAEKLKKTGIHPAFGEVNLAQLLSSWTVHDLGHIVQIARVMAKQYKEAVGPWSEYLGVLHK